MPYPSEHAARLLNPNTAHDRVGRTSGSGKGTVQGVKVPTTIDVIWYITGEGDNAVINPQALRFPIKNWTSDAVKKWLTDNKIKYISFEPAGKKASSEAEAVADKLLIYSGISSYFAEDFVYRLLEIDQEKDIEIYINSPGGSVFAGWSIIGALNERKGKSTAKVFGDASSMAFFMLLFMDKVEALDVSTFLIHRADMYVESEEDKQFLADINKQLRSKLEQKIDADIFESITGVTIDDIFSSDQRINVNLTAKQAKKIGLVDEIITIKPKQLESLSEKVFALFDYSEGPKNPINNKNHKTMNKQELQQEHPDVFKSISEDGANAERARVKAWMAWASVDPERVKKGISEGEEMTAEIVAEMTETAANKSTVETIKKDNPETVDTKNAEAKKAEEVKEEKELTDFAGAVRAAAGLKKEEVK